MASDLLNVGSQSVLTAQRQLNTTGHNISNANTEGYSRQSVIQGTAHPRQFGGQSYGMGVHVENVRRSWDQFAVKEKQIATTNYAAKADVEQNLEMMSQLTSSVSARKIPENLNDWFNSVKTLADTPNDVGARKVVIDQAAMVTNNLNEFHESVRLQAGELNRKLDVGVERMNQIGIEIRDLHRLMMRTPGPHNDLMDRHDQLIEELSEFTKVTVTNRANGEGFNVLIGNGHTLVSGTEASELKVIDGHPDVHQRRLAMVEGKGIKAISEKDIDGKIGAILTSRDEHIPLLLDEIGRVAAAFSYQVNDLQSQGLDLKGQVGKPLFTDVNSEAAAKARVVAAKDTQSELVVFIDDISQLRGGEYSVQFSNGQYHVINPLGEEAVIAPIGQELHFDGLRVEVRQGMAQGEKLFIRPTRHAAGEIKMTTSDPGDIAAQSFQASTTNAQGQADFKIVNVGTIKEFEVVVSPQGNEFAVTDTRGHILLPPQAYPPGGQVTVGGTVFELTEGALPNDKFTANLNAAEGDNGNLRKIQNLQTEKVMDDGETTLIGLYHNLNTDLAMKSSMASSETDMARMEKQAAEERIAAISGVNLDEEAANMMKFQQAYMASSRVMQTANDTFNTILALR
ncbi:flagellar hook-associated protein FlgK [Vibrio astriarenae]|uniref:Flagellar hook-associated protein 1 n=1 Tax=Vibrio astriarenae TaxID=1481923 RepID=A0A7Z2T483_9VIBR|nr:flagellar hook-associated protein FlgK [Vibrio astriarenae]QIA63922.1 flagellar hook-associated protein FlgK [Vibrio astriarenae]